MRTRTREETVYTFDELSDSARERALCDHEATLYDDWSECTIDYAKEVARCAGFTKPEIFWSGFSSQGDGACITGTWYASDVRDDGEWGDDVKALLAPFVAAPKGLSATLTHRGRYYHEQSVSIDWTWDSEDYDAPYPQEAVDSLDEAMRDLMRWVYRSLETEYEYQTSAEVFRETAEANEWEFLESGAIA